MALLCKTSTYELLFNGCSTTPLSHPSVRRQDQKRRGRWIKLTIRPEVSNEDRKTHPYKKQNHRRPTAGSSRRLYRPDGQPRRCAFRPTRNSSAESDRHRWPASDRPRTTATAAPLRCDRSPRLGAKVCVTMRLINIQIIKMEKWAPPPFTEEKFKICFF